MINLVTVLDRRLPGRSTLSGIRAKYHHFLHRSNNFEEIFNTLFVFIFKMGFDGLFFARLDYQDEDKRNQTKTMELVWKGSANLGIS